jgi:nucleotide-binding universal stress UspA family protein
MIRVQFSDVRRWLTRSTPMLGGVERASWIVVGIDFSDGAQRALEHAVLLARNSGAHVAVVHAYEDTAETAPGMADRASLLTTQLDDAVAGTNASGQGVHVESFLRRGAPWEKLQNVAVEVGADLIVVGATGQGGVTAVGAVLGSVVFRVIASSARSVLISRLPLDRARAVTPNESRRKEG